MTPDSPSPDEQRPVERIVSVRAWTEFEIVNHHQEGGLGIVYRALDRNLNREVALKVIRGKGVNDPETRSQFEKEIEITGRLEHPGIAPVYARGLSPEGNPFYAMRFVDGHDLSEEIDSFFELAKPDFSSVGFHRLLNTLISVCQTVAYAHGRGVIHRDIKPLNIRIGKFSETILLDWGLATVVERSDQLRSHDESTLILSSRTSSSASGGTPAYMSPEQLSGLSASPASDIYSLGAVLYRILTGKSTTEAIPGFHIREALLEGRIIPPRDVHPKVPRPLQAICLKALALHPKSRFESAIEMATELERYIAGQPIVCYKESLLERYNRWGRNHRMMIRFLGGCLLLATVFSLFMAITTLRLAESRNKQRMQAEMERSEAVRSKSLADIANRRSLQLAAQLGARSIATEIELRVSQLREEATQPLLRNWVFNLNKDPNDRKSAQELNSWLKDRFLLRVSEKMPTSTWIIQNAVGLQIGRVATREADGNASSLGKNFRFRDYFHAQGEDFPPDSTQANETKPHRFDVHVSTVFVSSSSSQPSVAFTTPIRQLNDLDRDLSFGETNDTTGDAELVGRGDPIGIFGSTLHLGKLDLIRGAMLVDIRRTKMDDRVVEGLVLRHPSIPYDSSKKSPVFSLAPEDLAKIKAIETSAVASRLQETTQATELVKITDPVTNQSIDVAVAVVFLVNQPEHSRVGWVVLMWQQD